MESAINQRPDRESQNGSHAEGEENAYSFGRGTGADGRGEPAEAEPSEAGRGGESSIKDSYPAVARNFNPTVARKVLDDIGQEFNQLREENKMKAWRTYQMRLMENYGILCELMTPKDITELCMKIEENITSTVSGTQETPLDECRNFLSGKAN